MVMQNTVSYLDIYVLYNIVIHQTEPLVLHVLYKFSNVTFYEKS